MDSIHSGVVVSNGEPPNGCGPRLSMVFTRRSPYLVKSFHSRPLALQFSQDLLPKTFGSTVSSRFAYRSDITILTQIEKFLILKSLSTSKANELLRAWLNFCPNLGKTELKLKLSLKLQFRTVWQTKLILLIWIFGLLKACRSSSERSWTPEVLKLIIILGVLVCGGYQADTINAEVW